MKRLAGYIIILFHVFACSSINVVDEPDPGLTPNQVSSPSEIEIIVARVPDSIPMGENAQFTLRVLQSTPTKFIRLDIDTVGKFLLEINGKNFTQIDSILADLSYDFKFTPKEEGQALMTFHVKSEKHDTSRTIGIRTYSPVSDIRFLSVPDSVAVNQSAEFRFIIRGATGESYNLKVDTIIPEFRMPLQSSASGQSETVISRGVELSVNGGALSDSIKLLAGYTNKFRIANPRAIGNYQILFTFTDKRGKETKITKTFHAYSPGNINIQFYNVNPCYDLHIEKDKLYDTLNQLYSYIPLSPVFQGQECDSTAYPIHRDSKEANAWNIVGKRGITFHIEQKGSDEFYFPADAIRYSETTAPLRPEIDGHDVSQTMQRSGFHGMLFYYITDRPYKVSTTYRLTVFDRWGKKAMRDFTVRTY